MGKTDLIELYRQRKITREDLVKAGYSPKSIWSILSRRGIKAWDTYKLDNDTIERLIQDYISGMNRQALSKKYGLKITRISALLYRRNVELWDIKSRRKPVRESKYFNWKELKYHYMVYNK